MAIKHLYIAFGRGAFPDDMLRYDQAKVIGGPFKRSDLNPELDIPTNENWGYYIIAGNVKPTIGRWTSFLWGVMSI